MIVPQDLPEAPDKVFMLATPAHMLTKLHWELCQLRKSLTEKPEHIGHTHAPSYCAFNFAVTAWHLADWTWKAAAGEQRGHILKCLNIESSGHDDKDFRKFQTAVRDRSRAIHICQQVANGSKHISSTTPIQTFRQKCIGKLNMDELEPCALVLIRLRCTATGS